MTIEEQLREGLEHHQAGRLAAASKCYLGVMRREQRHADATHLLGVVAAQLGRPVEGAALIARAISLAPKVWAYHHNRGEILAGLARPVEALAAFENACAVAPQEVAPSLALARLCRIVGRGAEALRHYRHAVTLAPDDAGAWHGLAVALAEEGRLDEAVASFGEALRHASANPILHHDLAVALARARRLDAAAEALRHAVAMKPDFAAAHRRLGAIAAALGRTDEALEAFRRAMALAPADFDAARELASLHEKRGEIAEAIAAYRQALGRDDDQSELHYHLAALDPSAPPPPATPAHFVVCLFDAYAERFDKHLVEGLRYRTPQLLCDAVHEIAPAGFGDVVDLGCGTGLCGPLLRPRARTLVGVDLSSGMIQKARARGIYDWLEVGELTAYLAGRPASFDLVLAADVFIYLGELAPVFAAAFAALRPGGILAFSVEAHEGDGFVLRRTRRYAHSRSYLRGLAAAHGLVDVRLSEAILRMNLGADVAGLLGVLRRPPPSSAGSSGG
ncbi:MAG: tetratricopeptide repeat protein [Alphaproteobacteria bacterium]